MAVTIYKYTEGKYLDLFFCFGKIRIGTLFDYRREEDLGFVIGDREEGQSKIIFENPPSVFALGGKSIEAEHFGKYLPIKGEGTISLAPGARIITTINSPNYYIYCASLKFNPNVMSEYGGSCIEIFDAEKFFAEINLVMKRKRKTSYQGLHRVEYCNRETDYKNPSKFHPALIKSEERKKDCEARAIWDTNGNEIKEPYIDIYVTKAAKWCRVHTRS